MTTEELHNYNRRQALSDISYNAVCTNEAIIEFRRWLTKQLELAYEQGFKNATNGKL